MFFESTVHDGTARRGASRREDCYNPNPRTIRFKPNGTGGR